jgi:hypothetical protein
MDPHHKKKGKGPAHSTKPTSKAKATTTSYTIFIDPKSRDCMQTIEEDVKVIKAYHEDQEVEKQAIPFFLNLGSNITRDTKFFIILDLYWHIKVFVAHEMVAKEPEFQNLKLIMESWER